MNIYVNEMINNMKKWSIPCNVITKDGTIEYYYTCGDFYKEDSSGDEVMLSEASFESEITNYKKIAKSIFVNENVYIINVTE